MIKNFKKVRALLLCRWQTLEAWHFWEPTWLTKELSMENNLSQNKLGKLSIVSQKQKRVIWALALRLAKVGVATSKKLTKILNQKNIAKEWEILLWLMKATWAGLVWEAPFSNGIPRNKSVLDTSLSITSLLTESIHLANQLKRLFCNVSKEHTRNHK